MFSELQDIGKDIKEEVQDIGFPAHGDMGGDISKCPYYAAKMGEEVVGGKNIYICFVIFEMLTSLSSSGERKHSLRMSVCQDAASTVNSTGDSGHMGCCCCRIGCLVSHVITFTRVNQTEMKTGNCSASK